MEAPNFPRLSEAFTVVSEECSKFANLPAFDQGANILNAIAQLGAQVGAIAARQLEMQTQMQQMQQMQQNLEGKFDNLERKIVALNQNSMARTQNSMVSFSDRELAPLVNISTAENIPNFPRTAALLSRMSNAAVNQVLLGLGLGTDSELEDKRNRIRLAIGLKVGGV